MTTSVNEVFKKEIVHQARYGNNGQVTVYYQLSEGSHVNVQVFNLLGQPVATLNNSYQMAGEYYLPFISYRKQLAKGQYFYRIQYQAFHLSDL